MAMEEDFALRSEENSQCFSLDIVRKASLPSMRSQLMSWSGSVVLGRGEEVPTWGGWRRTTKNTWSWRVCVKKGRSREYARQGKGRREYVGQGKGRRAEVTV